MVSAIKEVEKEIQVLVDGYVESIFPLKKEEVIDDLVEGKSPLKQEKPQKLETQLEESKQEEATPVLEEITKIDYHKHKYEVRKKKKEKPKAKRNRWMDKFEDWGGAIYYRTVTNQMRYVSQLREVTYWMSRRWNCVVKQVK